MVETQARPETPAALRDLRGWLAAVEAAGELRTIDAPVDPIEEMSAISYLVSKAEDAPPVKAPQPTPAATDAGPAPAGQTEPGADATTPADETKPADAAAPQSLLPDPSELQPVAFLAGEKVEVEILDWKGVEKWIASQKGKVVVVDMWSLSCEPCRREFPNLVSAINRVI